MSTVSLFQILSLTLRILVSLLLTLSLLLNCLVRREKCHDTWFMLEKRKKSKLKKLQIEVFFLPNINLLRPSHRI